MKVEIFVVLIDLFRVIQLERVDYEFEQIFKRKD